MGGRRPEESERCLRAAHPHCRGPGRRRTTMHARDVAALVLAAIAAHLALSHDGAVGLSKAWHAPTPRDAVGALAGSDYVPPPPVVVRGEEGGRSVDSASTPPMPPPFSTPSD